MRTPTRSSAVAIGSAFRCASGHLFNERLKLTKFGTLLHQLRWAFHWPLTADAPWSAIYRFLRCQIAHRVFGLRMVVPFVDDTKLVMSTEILLAHSNPVYIGLYEFQETSFMLHLLTEDDLFGDVGANVGIYSVLASGVRGAKSVAMEPVPATIEALRRNIVINKLEDLADIREIGVGAKRGELDFCTDVLGYNHVVEDGNGCRVPVLPLDEVFAARTPTLLKIDVEGFETNVIKGSQQLLKDTDLKAIVIELNGCGRMYGFDDRALDSEIRRFGFDSFVYDAFSRKLTPHNPEYIHNTLYVRDLAFVEHRLKAAKSFRVLGHLI
jgi:FkbM family methyltransferase